MQVSATLPLALTSS